MNKVKETMRLQNEEQERQWNKKQKEHEWEIHQLKEMRKEECERGVELRKELEKKLLSYKNTKTKRRNYKTS